MNGEVGVVGNVDRVLAVGVHHAGDRVQSGVVHHFSFFAGDVDEGMGNSDLMRKMKDLDGKNGRISAQGT